MQGLEGFGGPSLVGLVVGGAATWTLVYGFAVRLGVDPVRFSGRRLVAVAVAGVLTTPLLLGAAAGLSLLVTAVSGIGVPVWLSMWVVAGPLGVLVTVAYHDRVGGDPARWLGVGALAGFAVWPAVEYLAVVAAVTVIG